MGELLTGVLGKKVAFAATGVGEVAEQAKAGDVKILAVTSADPVEGVDAPTLKSLGVDMEFTNWRGIVGPPGCPTPKQEYVDLLTKMHDSEQWTKTLADQGWTDAFQTGDEFKAFLTRRTTASRASSPNWAWPDGWQQAAVKGAAPSTGGPPAARPRRVGHQRCAHAHRHRVPRPVNARTVPILVGLLLVLMAVLLTIDLLRGGRGEQEGGEDVDLTHGSDWRTVGLLVGSFAANACSSTGSAGPSRARSSSSARPSRWAAGTTCATRSSRSCCPWGPGTSSTSALASSSRSASSRNPLMDGINALLEGFGTALTPVNLLYAFLGVLLGTAIGVLPGIGPAMTIALLLPLTFSLEPTQAFIMFAGIYYGGMYGGSTTSILLNTPG